MNRKKNLWTDQLLAVCAGDDYWDASRESLKIMYDQGVSQQEAVSILDDARESSIP